MARLEAALARIEVAGSRVRADPALQDKHERLRSAVAGTLAQLDVMIESARV